MAQIEQIQIKFVAVEDRLLMRVSGGGELEFRFWLTRRFVKLIWPPLGKALAQSSAINAPVHPVAQREVLAFEHEKAVSDADFKTPYKETAKQLPLGDAPILLAKMQMKQNKDGSNTLSLGPEKGPGIDLGVNKKLLHSLTELIANAAKIAQWDLEPIAQFNGETATQTPRIVN